jgi:tetratricopeptide (TPR) repeat protein
VSLAEVSGSDLIDLLRADQQQRWGQGERVPVEVYLQRYPAIAGDVEAVLDLIYGEALLREGLGETDLLADYLRRFPQLAEALRRQFALHQLGAGLGQLGAAAEADAPNFLAARPPVPPAGPPPADPKMGWPSTDPPGRLPPPPPGEALNDWPAVPGYVILGKLGQGGQAVVYLARHLGLERLVALKIARGGVGEARAVAQLQHPNIVQVFDVDEHADPPYFSLEYCPGGSLEKKLAGNLLPARAAARLVEILARAVHCAHERGIVHRDLKPANVLLVRSDRPQSVPLGGPDQHYEPKVTDFGLAKRVDQAGPTVGGGTPPYMAPEQARGVLDEQVRGVVDEVDHRTDVYALGAILYELLTGRPPFKAATPRETLEQVCTCEPVPLARLQPGVPRDLETICLKCLHKEPHKRYAFADDLADDLGRFLRREPVVARRVRLWERAAKWARRRPAVAGLAGLLVALGLLLAVGGWVIAAQQARTLDAEKKRQEAEKKRQEAEKKRQADARAEVLGLRAGGETATKSKDWNRAEGLLDKALEKIEAESALADLREKVEAVRARVKDQLQALRKHKRFVENRDAALFYATLATGENYQANRKTARQRARAALAVVGLSPEGQGALSLSLPFSEEQKKEIITGCYALLLLLAETQARHLPGQGAEEQLKEALALLDCADGLRLDGRPVRTRAIHLRRARYLALQGDVTGAANERGLARIRARQPDLDPKDHFLVGQELYGRGDRGDLARANEEFRRALHLDARHFWTHYFLGVCCVMAKKPEEAVTHLSICQSQQKDAAQIWIYLLRGFAFGEMGDYAAAEKDFDRALDLKPSPATLSVLLNNRGEMRISQEGAWARGVKDLRQSAGLCPDRYHAWASLAKAYRLQGRLDEASNYLDEAVAVAKLQVRAGNVKPATLALLYHSRAHLHRQRQDWEAVLRDLAEAARLAGNDGPLRAGVEADRGRVLHLQERFKEALAAYDGALKADPNRVIVFRWKGEVLLDQNRYEDACRRCEARPPSPCEMLLDQKRYDDAAAAFDAYLKKGGAPSAAVYRQRGLAHAQRRRHAEAIDDYGRALQAEAKDKERALLYLARGREFLTVNALQPALRAFEKAVGLDPNNADASLGLAYARVKLGDARRGVTAADRVVQGIPEEPHLWHGAARVYAQAAAQVEAEPRRPRMRSAYQERLAVLARARMRSHYQERAVELLSVALHLVPAQERRAYWQERVLNDPALDPIRPELARLAVRFGAHRR